MRRPPGRRLYYDAAAACEGDTPRRGRRTDEQLRQLLERVPEIRLAVLFGSTPTDRARSDSDIDVAVLTSEPLAADRKARLNAAIAEATGRPVDLVDLSRAGEPLRGEILRGGHRILERDPHAWTDLVCRHLWDATDFLPYRQRILAGRRRAWLER